MLTIAPTGTTSLMSQTTSGIEPVFRPVYKRRRKINPSDQDAKVAFVDDMGESSKSTTSITTTSSNGSKPTDTIPRNCKTYRTMSSTGG